MIIDNKNWNRSPARQTHELMLLNCEDNGRIFLKKGRTEGRSQKKCTFQYKRRTSYLPFLFSS